MFQRALSLACSSQIAFIFRSILQDGVCLVMLLEAGSNE